MASRSLVISSPDSKLLAFKNKSHLQLNRELIRRLTVVSSEDYCAYSCRVSDIENTHGNQYSKPNARFDLGLSKS